MKPIPKKLLIHKVTHYRTTNDRWGKETPGEKVVIKNVRMEPASRVIRDKNNSELQLSATLFFDCKNSRPVDMEFYEDDIVEFNGQKHQIKTIDSLYDEKRLHHYEIGLVKKA